MRKAGGLTRAPNETASVKQPKLAGFPITQHHFAPWQGRGHPNRPTDDRRQRMGNVHGERGAMQFVVYGQINVYGVTTKSERHKRSYWTRTADGNGIGGRKAPVPYGS